MTNWKDVSETVQSAAGAAAIIVGGVFAFFKFVKDGVYRPRFEVGIDAGIIELGEAERYLVCRAIVQNKSRGTTLLVRHEGTAVVVRTGSTEPSPLRLTRWSEIGDESTAVVDVFAKHDWLVSTETIHDDIVIRASRDVNCLYKLELRLVIANPLLFRRGNVVITTSHVVPATQRWQPLDSSNTATKELEVS